MNLFLTKIRRAVSRKDPWTEFQIHPLTHSVRIEPERVTLNLAVPPHGEKYSQVHLSTAKHAHEQRASNIAGMGHPRPSAAIPTHPR